MKRSRTKQKAKTSETRTRVKKLKTQNHLLEEKIKNKSKDLKFLKELFLAQAQAQGEKLAAIDLKALLRSDDEEDESD